jgi:tRNA threonylcarbamoyladenosine biosynthesis protein TsaB
MKILAIDTVSEMCSCALWHEDTLSYREQWVPQQHTHMILPMVQELLQEAKIELASLDALAFSRGPGSFTGLRICASVTQGLALAHALPVLPVSSLAALAQGAFEETGHESVMACMDARKAEVYWACFVQQDGVMQAITHEQVSPAAEVATPTGHSWHGVGNGFSAYAVELQQNSSVNVNTVTVDRYPLARHLIPIARKMWQDQQSVDASLAIPVYLRDNIATPSGR